MRSFDLLAQNAQTEYGLGFWLVFGLVFLGLLVVCIPRPRKSDLNPDKKVRKKKKPKKKKKKTGKKKAATKLVGK